MDKLTHSLLVVASTLALAVPAPQAQAQAQAQSVDCGADEGQCLSDSLQLACRVSEARAESCIAWVEQVEAHAFAWRPEWRVAAGRGYFLAAELSSSTEQADGLKAQSRSVFQDVIAAWPDSSYAWEAYRGLSVIARDIDEKISSLRSALRTEPNHLTTMMFLADALVKRGGARDVSEAADLYRNAYLESGDPPAWTFAQRALGLYAASGETDQEAAFREQVARDSGMTAFAEEVTSERFAEDLERAAEVLDTACNRFIAAIFGPGTCESGIDSMVVATRLTADLNRRRAIADIAVQGMSELGVLGAYTAVTAAEKNERDYRFGTILQEWINTGAATARVYVLWAQNPNSDLDEGIAAFERAVELAPDNGRYRYRLAQGYIARGRYDEAIEHLNLARDTLPENGGLTPESVDRQIGIAERARSRTR